MNKYSMAVARNWAVMEKEFVFVDEEKLIREAENNAFNDFVLPDWNIPYIHPISNRVFVSHCFWHSVVNFCYGHPYTKKKDNSIVKFEARDVAGNCRSGSYAMGACWYRRFGENEILAKDVLKVFGSLSQTKKFFRGRHHIPLAGERRMLLTESAYVLNSYFGGDPRNILEEGNYRAFGNAEQPGIVEILVDKFRLTFGSDFYELTEELDKEYLPLYFPFYKRAQLFVLGYHLRAVASKGELKPVEDIERLGPIADYILPKFYAATGVFNYDFYLRRAVDHRLPITPGSRAEIEIRAATVWTQLQELKIINEIRKSEGVPEIHIGHLDDWAWSFGRVMKTNHHICLTTSY